MTSAETFPGSPIARGPMGGDQFTQIHNLVFRDPTLSAKAMGVFGHLSTHTEQWRVNEKTVAANMRDGRDSVRSALRELEQHSYLIRSRNRRADGSLGEAVWFVTDLPAQFRALGITDDALVTAKVREHFEQWENTRSTPTTENPSLALTCENDTGHAPNTSRPVDNSPIQPSFPSAAPKSDFPTLDFPTLGNPRTKNTNPQNTNPTSTSSLRSDVPVEEEHHPSGPVGEDQDTHEDTADPAGVDGWMDNPSNRENNQELQKPVEQDHTATHSLASDDDTSGHGCASERGGQAAKTPGSVLLAKIETQHGIYLSGQRTAHIASIDAALAVLPERHVTTVLGDGLDQAHHPTGALVERIRTDLTASTAQWQQQREQAARRRAEDRAATQRRRATPAASDEARAAAMAAVPAAGRRTRSSERDARWPGPVPGDTARQSGALSSVGELLANEQQTDQSRGDGSTVRV